MRNETATGTCGSKETADSCSMNLLGSKTSLCCNNTAVPAVCPGGGPRGTFGVIHSFICGFLKCVIVCTRSFSYHEAQKGRAHSGVSSRRRRIEHGHLDGIKHLYEGPLGHVLGYVSFDISIIYFHLENKNCHFWRYRD